MSFLEGSCHCGKIRLSLEGEVAEACECNCSICRRTAGLWHYCRPDQLRATGDAVSYRQGDCMLDTWHCGTCGCTTHWTAVDPGYERVGVNIRMFDPDVWQGLPRRPVDGASF